MKLTLRTLVCALLIAIAAGATAPPSQAASRRPAASWSVDGRVLASVIVGNTLIVGGNFATVTSPGGTRYARRNLAAISMNTGAVIGSWRADSNGVVRALEASGGSVYAGGSFGLVGGVARARIAKLSAANGAVDRRFTGHTDNTVKALELEGSSLFLGGTFTEVDGVGRSHIAKVSASTGALVRSFAAVASGQVNALQKRPGTGILYVGGTFSRMTGASRLGLAAISGVTGATTRTVFAHAPRRVLGLTVNGAGTRLYAAAGGRANSAMAWKTSNGRSLWAVKTDGDVQTILYVGGLVYFGFHDGYRGNSKVKLLAARSVGGHVLPFRPMFRGFWGVFSLASGPAGFVAGGEFRSVAGVSTGGFARFTAPGPAQG